MIIQNPSIQHHQILKGVCQPLESLGISFFGYTAVDKDNNAYCLGSGYDYAYQYLDRGLAKVDVHYHNEQAAGRVEYNFWDFIDMSPSTEELYKMAVAFDHSHTLSITRHEKDITHCYHFSGRVHDDRINQRYLSHLDSLHAYIDYFDDCLINIPEIAEVYANPVCLGSQRIPSKIQVVSEHPATIDKIMQSSVPIRFKRFYQYYLSRKERNCLYWMKLGKSARMIAEINQVSVKTVERYIASIKKKLDCYTLLQVGMKIKTMQLEQFLLSA